MVDIVGELRHFANGGAGDVSAACSDAITEIERLRKIEEMARYVLEKFQKDEAQGYHTKDREFAISLLAKGFEMAAAPEQSTPKET